MGRSEIWVAGGWNGLFRGVVRVAKGLCSETNHAKMEPNIPHTMPRDECRDTNSANMDKNYEKVWWNRYLDDRNQCLDVRMRHLTYWTDNFDG